MTTNLDADHHHHEKQGLVTKEIVTHAVEVESNPNREVKKHKKKVEVIEVAERPDPLFLVMCLGLQAVFLILFAIGADYRREKYYDDVEDSSNEAEYHKNLADFAFYHSKFSLYQDIHGMMLVGFGFLMTYLRRYSFSSIAFNFLLCAMCIQWQLIMFGAICQGWYASPGRTDQGWGRTLQKYRLNIDSLTDADLGTAAILISMGAVLGRTNPSQLLLMAFLEVPLYAVNFYICMHYLRITDVGGSIVIHVFGCYFGLAASFVIGRPKNVNDNKSMYHSDLFAMIGTLFLWLYWPSFNAYYAYDPSYVSDPAYKTGPGHRGMIQDSDRTRAYVNTVLSLCGATMATFAFSKWFRRGRLEMVHIQNATLAGGVVMGACADLYVHPAGAIGIGFTAGLLSTIGYRYIQDFLAEKLHLYDTCGVNNLHGMPGILGCVASAITVGCFNNKRRYLDNDGHSRNKNYQAGYQIAGLIVTFAISILGGLITGAIMKFAIKPEPEHPYNDVDNFVVPGITAPDFFKGTIRGKKGPIQFARDEHHHHHDEEEVA